jgi:Tfp pilus assembly protein PilO
MSRTAPIIGVVLLIFLILGGVFLWWPKYESFQEITAKFEAKEKELIQKQEYFKKLEEASKKLEDYGEQLAKIDSAFPEEFSAPELFDFMQKTSASNGLILKDISSPASGAQTAGAMQKVSFSVSALGSYEAMKNLLSSLFKTSRMIDVNSVAFGASETGGSDINFRLELSTQYYPKPASAGPAEEQLQ